MEGDVMDKVEATATVCDFDPMSGSIPATKVEITVSCRNLLDRDTFSKSDPLVVLYTQGVESKQWREMPPGFPGMEGSRCFPSVVIWRSIRRWNCQHSSA
ncbi:Copine-5 [Ataeniobius toweri]|uniref:Copine-5 n=1 Tax=Ataeniobius toweri TaxID=208326 RepID=A0ABU7BJG4_9TELE|nr:Copine-5 [Ataeniobius toweri]